MKHVMRFLLDQGATILLIGCFAGVGWWGYSNEWKIPKFSDLRGIPEVEAKAPSIEVSEPTSKDEDCAAVFTNRRITFPNSESVHRAGILALPVVSSPMASYIAANGVIEYDQTLIAHLSTRVPGIAWRVEKHLGDHVKRGDILALVESAEVGKAKADFLQYMVLVDIKKKVFENLRPSVVPERQIQEAEAALREARIRLFTAQQALINLGLPVRLDDYYGMPEQKLAEAIRELGLPPELAKTLDWKSTSANLIPLKAPFDGVVIGRDMVNGEIVTTTMPQFTVADISKMWILLDLKLEDASSLALGQEASFRPDGLKGQEVHGMIQWISTEVEEKTRTVRVRIEVDNSKHQLRARAFGTGRILIRSWPAQPTVPDEAVQEDDNCRVVFVKISPTVFESRLVRIGARLDGFTQILEGLTPQEQVVKEGSHALKSELLKSRISTED